MSVEALLEKTGMWRASRFDYGTERSTPSGFPVLDRYLAGGGWPRDGIVELLFEQPGIGELRLISPALARLSQEQSRWLAWISPPYLPYPPSLAMAGIDLSRVLVVQPKSRADKLWILEQALKSASCSAVIAWPGQLNDREIRRFQLACKNGRCVGFLMLSGPASKEPPGSGDRQFSPAELRLALAAMPPAALSDRSRLHVSILKRRKGWPVGPLSISFNDALGQQTPDYSEINVERKAASACDPSPSANALTIAHAIPG